MSAGLLGSHVKEYPEPWTFECMLDYSQFSEAHT